ncbi:MAG: hypothetical protein K5853_07245 [Lachnospiraceae bacterium]|nr:hypothetical protein [Lachnospiraceae bacterium]
MKDLIKQYKVNLILLLGVLLSSLPLVFPGIEGHFGQDLGFHLNRIEGIYIELKNGVFPVRMQSFWMEGYGYPVSIYYGDIFLYFPALLRLFGMPVVAAYKLFLLSVNIFTVWVAYICFGKILGGSESYKEVPGIGGDDLRMVAAIGALVYATANYRLLNLYIRAAVGEYTAMLFLPVVALAVYEIYYRDPEDPDYPRAVAPLVIGMSGILESHMMTLEMVCILLAVICLLNLKKTFRPATLRVWITGAALTLLLNLSFILPFLDYFLTENVRINNVVQNARQIQESGAYIWEYFAFFMIPFSNLEPGITSDRMSVTPGVILIAVCFVGAFLFVTKKTDAPMKKLLVGSGILLLVSSHFFPWNYLSAHTRVGNFLAQVQFPWRYIGIASLLLTLLLLLLLRQIKAPGRRIAFCLILGTSLFMCLWFARVYHKYAEFDHFAKTEDLDTYDMGFIEYLRPDAVREEFTHRIEVVSGDAEVGETFRQGTAADYEVSARTDAVVELPILHYKYYALRDDEGRVYELKDGANDVIAFKVPAGFRGDLHLRYEEPLLWHVAEVVSLFTFLALCTLCLQKRKEWTKTKAGSAA